MERLERFYRIEAMLQNGRHVPSETFLEKLEVSISTFKRDLEYMRSRFSIPIEWSADEGGYFLNAPAGKTWTLPGLWFNSDEAFALLTMKNLLSDLEPGLLGNKAERLLSRVEELFKDQTVSAAQVEKRVVLRKTFARSATHADFSVIATALLRRKRVEIVHHNRDTGEQTVREVSPQRMVHHRDNWYLDAWCHLRNSLRSFGLDAIERASLLDQKAKEVSLKDVSRSMDDTYGIFSSGSTQWAVLSFSAKRAQWVGREVWHPKQTTWRDDEGRHYMKLPYSDTRELVMDILRHLPDVRVEEPEALRREVKDVVGKWLASEG